MQGSVPYKIGVDRNENCFNYFIFGQGAIADTDTIKARNLAFDNALSKAVEKGVGRFLSEKDIAGNEQSLEQQIYSKTGRYIKSLDITKEGVSSDMPGNYSVTLKATLVADNLEHDLAGLGLLNFRANLPRVLVMVQEKNVDVVHWHVQSKESNSAENIIWNVLEIKGFKSVDQTGLIANLTPDIEKAFYTDDVRQALTFSAGYDADIVIIGKAISRPITVAGASSDSLTVQAMVTLKAYRTSSGEEIANSATSASTITKNEIAGGAIAITKAAEEAALKLAPGIIENWTTVEETTVPITMFINGLKSIEDLITFKHEFRDKVSSVKTFERRTFSGSAAAYDLEITNTVPEIVAELSKNELKSFEVQVRSQSENALELKVKLR